MKPVPQIVDVAADRAFRHAARAMGLDPDDRWVGGYVENEWWRSRFVYELLDGGVAGRDVLEFGCNFGATSVVLAALGARVTAVDVNEAYVRLASINAARFGLQAAVRFHHVRDTRSLPFADASFDVISCNSVLEYVPARLLPGVQRELDRVLRPKGLVVVLGTSNRLWPREVHSRRWLVNYVPRWMDRLFAGTELQRGLSPWRMLSGFGRAYENADRRDRGYAYLQARVAAGSRGARLALLRTGNWCAQMLGTSVGLFTPSMSVVLRKRG